MNQIAPGENAYALILLTLAAVLTIFLSRLERGQISRKLRDIRAFMRLRREIGLSVEAGKRLHILLGSGGIQDLTGAPGLMGLSITRYIARLALVSDRTPIVNSGEGTLAILAQDVLNSSLNEISMEGQIDPDPCRISGLTPSSYAAGALPAVVGQDVSVNIIAGSFGSEVALLTDAAERIRNKAIGGSENLTAQAVLYASSQDVLIGEELFAASAYLDGDPIHLGSLFTQDVLRWIIIFTLLVGVILKILGVI